MQPIRDTLLAQNGWQLDRILGAVGHGGGPTVIVFGGIHGNEPAGALAFLEVLEDIESRVLGVRGRLVGIAGNRQALARGRRYLDHDLNRRWTKDALDALHDRAHDSLSAEEREQAELVEALHPYLERDRRSLICVDLHTSSGSGPPFCTVAAGPRSRMIASALPIPLILGISEHIRGTMLDYLCGLGCSGISIEGGQHADPEAVGNHVSALWLLLVAMGVIDEWAVDDLAEHGRRLAELGDSLPRAVEILHRHVIKPGDEFRMEPGFSNFQPVERGQVLARDSAGPIAAEQTGRLLLPLYQGQGEDGFFLARDVGSAWS